MPTRLPVADASSGRGSHRPPGSARPPWPSGSDEDRTRPAAAHAGGFARRRAHQAAHERQRVVAPDDFDRGAVVTLPDRGHEARDVDVGGARAVAGRRVAFEAETLRAGFAPRVLLPLLAEVRSELPSGQAAARPWAAISRRPPRVGEVPCAPRPMVISVTRRAARASSECTGRVLVLGELPMAIERATGPAHHAHVTGQHHQARRHGDDAAAANARGSPAGAWERGRNPPRPSSKTITVPGRSAPPPQRPPGSGRLRTGPSPPGRAGTPRRSVSSDASSSVSRRTGARSGTRSPAYGRGATRRRRRRLPGARLAVAHDLHLRRGLATWASDRMASTALRKAASRPVEPAGRRSSTVRLSRRPGDHRALAISQGAPSRTAVAPALSSNPVASITSVDGPWPRRKRRQARWIGSPPPGTRRGPTPGRAAVAAGGQGLGAVETRQRAGEGLRRRRRARQGGRAGVEPRGQLLDRRSWLDAAVGLGSAMSERA